jgi:transcriptional regulator with XRE-family HTH domain
VTEHLTAASPRETPTQFGRLIRQHRSRIGLTQRELADFSTISVRAIRDLEQGRARQPRHDTVRLIADGLRLGPKAREALETAANRGRSTWALKTGYDTAPPAPPTAPDPLLGRDAEVRALVTELSDGRERLMHIVGLSGVGKTRLALEVAARLHEDADLPVLWFAPTGRQVEYRSAGPAESLAPLVLACVEEVFPQIGAELAVDAGLAGFTGLVDDQPALLVIDGADEREPHPEALDRLLRECPRLRLLITSAAPFGLAGERPFLLGPLATPTAAEELDLHALEQVPSAALLLDRIRRATPGQDPDLTDVGAVAEICRLLDGLPQALCDAASWLVVYDLPTLLGALADGPASLLGHLGGADGGSHLREALAHAPLQLPEELQELLTGLCHLGTYFDLADVVALTGADMSACGRMLRELLLLGVVRPCHESGRSRFQVLNLVRAAQLVSTASGLPGELPPAPRRQVFHGDRARV